MRQDFFKTYCIFPQDTMYLMPSGSSGKRNSTIIQTTQAEITVPLHMKTVKKKYYDLSSISQRYAQNEVIRYIGKKILTPIPIHPNIVLMPVKSRLQEGSKRAYGYVNMPYIVKIVKSGEEGYPSCIVFRDESTLLSPQSVRSLEQNYVLARYVQNRYFTKCAEAGIIYEITDLPSTSFPEWEPV